MGNCFQRCFGDDSDSEYLGGHRPGHGYGGQEGGGSYSRPGPISYTVVGFTAVGRDLLEFETTNKVPGALGYYVSASKATQKIWYEKLLAAWKRENPAPQSAEAVAVLLIQTLQGCSDIQGLLRFYHLSWPAVPVSRPVPASERVPEVIEPEAGGTWLVEPEAAEDIQFEIRTLPVKWEENKGDGDGFTVFVDVNKNAWETENLPKEIKEAVSTRRKARAQKNYEVADALQKKIEAERKYRVFDGKNGGIFCLARKYNIRLRGVDAPEIRQSYGEEAKVILRNLVKDQQLVIHVYNMDKYERAVGDVYCNGIFIQEELLKKGMVWHFKHFDKREKFAKWERDAKAARLGLWADANPEPPWDYRKKHRRFDNKKRGSVRKRGG